MNVQNNIDLLLTLEPHGWSICTFYIDGNILDLPITHIFNDPYFELIQVLTKLINGEKSRQFLWYSEPNGHRIEITQKSENPNMYVVEIYFFENDCDTNISNLSFVKRFDISLKQIVTLFYFQLNKTFWLLKDKTFALNRADSFPFQDFRNFEKKALVFLEM